MRIVVNKYIDGRDYMAETSDDGVVLLRELRGTRAEPGKLIDAFMDVMCGDDEKSLDQLLEAISWLREEVEKRKHGLAEQKEKPKKGRKTA